MRPAKQPRRGTVQTDTKGRRWRKVERLEREAWLHALADSVFDARIVGVTDESFERLGYRLVDDEVRPAANRARM